MSPDLVEGLRNLGIAVVCVLGSGAVGGAIVAEWAAMRDYLSGQGQPTPVWTAEERWG